MSGSREGERFPERNESGEVFNQHDGSVGKARMWHGRRVINRDEMVFWYIAVWW